MGIFSGIMDAIFHHQAAAPAPAPDDSAAPADPAAPPAAPAPVDVNAVLTDMAANVPNPGNWDSSIVDLLNLLGLESSLDAREKLADELDVHVADAGAAEENIALYKAVMNKLADNGGIVPDNLKN